MDAIVSDRRVTEQLWRLLCIVGGTNGRSSIRSSAASKSTLCVCDAGCDLRTKELAAAAAEVPGCSQLADKVMAAVRCANFLCSRGHDVSGCALETSR